MSTALADSPAAIIQQMLIDLGQGTEPAEPTPTEAWPVYATLEPEAPDDCITVYDTDPVDDGRSMIDGERWQHQGFQVRIRSSTFRVGWTKANALAVAMDEHVYQRAVVLNGSNYVVHVVNRTGGPLALGQEVPISKRFVFTVNAKAPIQQI